MIYVFNRYGYLVDVGRKRIDVVVYRMENGLPLDRYERIIRDLMLAGY